MADNLKLNCLFVIEKSTFSIVISRRQSVEDLQKAIQANKQVFQKVDPNLLELHKVSILPVNRIRSLSELGLVGKDPLVATDELSDVFKEAPEPKHVHIVVVAPPPTVQSELELNCWVTDEDHRNIFPIEIARTRTVGALKDAIKDKRKRAFEDVDSSSLVLWKVDVEKNKRFEELKLDDGIDGVQKLDGFDEISVVFPGPARKYIVAVEPLTGNQSHTRATKRLRGTESEELHNPDSNVVSRHGVKRRRLSLLEGSETIYQTELDVELQRKTPELPGNSHFDHLIMTPGILAADKTKYIEELDKSREYQYMFLRPRRWGKSTFLQMLADYYDKSKAEKFDDAFGQLYIGKHPTRWRSSMLVLLFDFSEIETFEKFRESFDDTLNQTLRAFLDANAKFLGYPDPEMVIVAKAKLSLQAVLNLVRAHNEWLFVGVDEYDAPANACLFAANDEHRNRFDEVADVFKTQFFAVMKKAMGVVVRKYWLTGVLPAFRDGISPLSATAIISKLPQYHGLCGFTREEVDAIAAKYLASTHSPDQIKSAVRLMKAWYNGYLFGHGQSLEISRLFNPQLVFTHLRAISLKSAWLNPREEANGTHSAIVLSAMGGRDIASSDLLSVLNNNLDVTILNEFGPSELQRLGQDRQLTWSFLYYLGVVTHNDESSSFRLPNATMRFIVMERLSGYLRKDDSNFKDMAAACGAFIEGNPKQFVGLLEEFLRLRAIRSARDSKESGLQSIVELCWFMDGRCVPEMCLLANPSKMWGDGRFGFVDIFIASSAHAPLVRMPVIELKNVSLRGVWVGTTEGPDDEPHYKDLLTLHSVLKTEPEEQLLKRRYVYWQKESGTWQSQTIEDLKYQAFDQVKRYLRLIKNGRAVGSASGVLDDRIRCKNGKTRLDGYVLLCIGNARVLGWCVGTEEAPYVFEKY